LLLLESVGFREIVKAILCWPVFKLYARWPVVFLPISRPNYWKC
jgi:hypothetical protein